MCLQHPGWAQETFAEGPDGVSSQDYFLGLRGRRQQKQVDSGIEQDSLPPWLHGWRHLEILSLSLSLSAQAWGNQQGCPRRKATELRLYRREAMSEGTSATLDTFAGQA